MNTQVPNNNTSNENQYVQIQTSSNSFTPEIFLDSNDKIRVIKGLILLISFFNSLTKSTKKIEKLFKDEEVLLKADKKYKVKRRKKLTIKYEIQKILKMLEIKIIFFQLQI